MIEQCINQNIVSLRERLVTAVQPEPESFTILTNSSPTMTHPMSAHVMETSVSYKTVPNFVMGGEEDDIPPTSATVVHFDLDQEESVFNRESMRRTHKSAGDMRGVMKDLPASIRDRNVTRALLVKESQDVKSSESRYVLTVTFQTSDDDEEDISI